MGDVYRAYDTYRDRDVALKLLHEGFSGDREYLKRFQRESNVAARLTEPHVIPIHDFGEVDGQLFIDMRLVEGADIGKLLEQHGRLAPQRAVHLISQVAEALDAAHADHLVHRDIKPSNILVTASDFVYVVDFGIARSFGRQQTALTITGTTIGTLQYMAPERFEGQATIDGRADIYSLACVLHECLTGETPFTGKDLPALLYAQIYSTPPAASSLAEGVPPALDAVISRGMAKNPKDRFATAGELAAAARDALGMGAPTSPVPAEPPAPPMSELPPPPWAQTPAPAWAETPSQEWNQAPAQEWGETTAAAWNETPAPPWEELPEPTRQPATTHSAWQEAAAGPGGEAPPPGGHFAESAPPGGTQAAYPGGADSWGDTLLPGQVPPVTRLDRAVSTPPPAYGPPSYGPESYGPPPGGPGRADPGSTRRRIGVFVLAVLVALAVPIVVVLLVSNKPKSATPGATQSVTTVGGTNSAAASTSASAATSAPVANLALPTVAGKVPVGPDPSDVEVAPNGKFAYIVSPAAGRISVLNTASNTVSGTPITLPAGKPEYVAFSPDSKTAYVSVDGHGVVPHVAFIDTATGALSPVTVPVDNFIPAHLTVSPDGKFLYVANHNTATNLADDNVVDVVDTASKSLVTSVHVKATPHWVVFTKDGKRFYTTDHLGAAVTVVNAATNTVLSNIPVHETPHSEILSPDGSSLAVTSYDGNEVYLISTATDKVTKTIAVGKEPVSIAYSTDGRYLFTVNTLDDTVSVINAASGNPIGTIPTGKGPTSIAVLPGGHQAYVADSNDGNIEIINIPQ
jgi:serine/threonine-protein kinase